MGRQDYETETLLPMRQGGFFDDATTGTLTSNGDAHSGFRDERGLIAHALTGEGFDASEEGTGRGTPLVPVAFDARQHDVLMYGDKSGPLDTDGHSVAVMTLAIRGRGESCDLEVRGDGTANCLQTPSGGRGGMGVGAVAIHENQRGELTTSATVGSLECGGGKPGQGYPAALQGMAVRRLLPVECMRLQGWPDDHLDGLGFADGTKYRMAGNGVMANVAEWIGRRIVAALSVSDAK